MRWTAWGPLLLAVAVAAACGGDDPAPRAEASTSTTTTAPRVTAEEAAVCTQFGVVRPPPPTTESEAQAWFEVVSGWLAALDDLIPPAIADDWTGATEGVRMLAIELEASGFDHAAIDFGAPEFAPDPAARARIEGWCAANGVEVPAPVSFELPVPSPPVHPEPPEECALSSARSVHLGGDDELDWIVPSPGDTTVGDDIPWLVCDSQREDVADFVGPRHFEAVRPLDVDADGVDDLVLIGATTAYSLVANVWTNDPASGLAPLLDEQGAQLGVEDSGWWEEKTTTTGWIGCADLDGDGRLGFVTGTYDVVDGAVDWVGEELTIRDSVVVDRVRGEGVDEGVGDVYWPSRRLCPAAQDVRVQAAAPCASMEPWPGGEPWHGYSELTDVAPVESGDVLVYVLPVVEVWRDATSIGPVVGYDNRLAPAYHDLRGGLVVDSGALGTILHLPFRGDAVQLLVPAEAGEMFLLMGVAEIDATPTAIVIRRVGESTDVSGELLLVPLDGSAPSSLPAPEYYEGGTDTVDWTGDHFVLVGGGEGSSWMHGMDLDGNEVDLPWNRWPEGWDWDLHLDVAVDADSAWIATTQGLLTVLQERDVITGALRRSDVIPAVSRIDLAGDRLLLQQGREDVNCIRLYDPDTGEIEELRLGGRATVG